MSFTQAPGDAALYVATASEVSAVGAKNYSLKNAPRMEWVLFEKQGSGQDRLSTLRARRGWDKEKPDLGVGRAY